MCLRTRSAGSSCLRKILDHSHSQFRSCSKSGFSCRVGRWHQSRVHRAGCFRVFGTWTLDAARNTGQGMELGNVGGKRASLRAPGFGHGNNRVMDREGWPGGLSELCDEGSLDATFQSVELAVKAGSVVSRGLVSRVLQRCRKEQNLAVGRRLHALIVKCGLEEDPFLGYHLIRMFSACGSLVEAKEVFAKLPAPDKFVWPAIISAHTRLGDAEQAIQLYYRMRECGGKADDYMFVAVLSACSSAGAAAEGKMIHADVVECGSESNVFVANAVIDMYCKCGNLVDASNVFDRLLNRDLVTWTVMITGYAQHGRGQDALQLFQKMQKEGIHPDKVTVVNILKACSGVDALAQGKMIHSYILNTGMESDLFVGSSLIGMYMRCGSLEDAREVFDRLPTRDLVTWTSMIAGYAEAGESEPSFRLFLKMQQQQGLHPDKVTILSMFKACSTSAALEMGKLIHAGITGSNLESDLSVGSTLINMYSNCDSMADACKVFNRLPSKHLVTWTAMISGYVQHGGVDEAFNLFGIMQQEGVVPDKVVLVSMLKACSSIAAVDQGKVIHASILRCGFQSDVMVGNALIDMYSKCGSLDIARSVFDSIPRDLVSWNIMIASYVRDGDLEGSLNLLQQMQQEGLQPDNFTIANILTACSTGRSLDQGKAIHAYLCKSDPELDPFFSCILIDLYVKCGSLSEGRMLFDKLANRDPMSWTKMIAGYAQHGRGEDALSLFHKMEIEGVQPDEGAVIGILKACHTSASLDVGKLIHSYIEKREFQANMFVAGALMDMYAKCGDVKDAQGVFDRLPEKSIACWNTMIAAYARHGEGQVALQLFQQMQEEGSPPDSVTFTCVLSACSHSCLKDEGIHLFQSMSSEYGIVPQMEHYACIVDLLGRSSSVGDAEQFIHTIPLQLDIVVWMSLLGSCRTHVDVEVGERAFDAILMLDSTYHAAYVLMADLYQAARRPEKRAEIRKMMHSTGAKKQPGRTWMEVNNERHIFVAHDQQHPERGQIHDYLISLMEAIEEPQK